MLHPGCSSGWGAGFGQVMSYFNLHKGSQWSHPGAAADPALQQCFGGLHAVHALPSKLIIPWDAGRALFQGHHSQELWEHCSGASGGSKGEQRTSSAGHMSDPLKFKDSDT